MAEHSLKTSLNLDLPRTVVFDFFADAANLERITPPELGFHIITPQPIEIGKGTMIDYRLRVRGFPVGWRTEITGWDPPNSFVDTQIKGPYAQWVHTHTFTEIAPAQTLIDDEVRYRLPLEPLGGLVHFLIRRELEYIFAYRQKTVAEILSRQSSNEPLA